MIPHCTYPNDDHDVEWIAPRILESTRELGIHAIDLRDMVDPALYVGCHWNAEGHLRTAQRIVDSLAGTAP